MSEGNSSGSPSAAVAGGASPHGSLAPIPQRPLLAPLGSTENTSGRGPGSYRRPAPIPTPASQQSAALAPDTPVPQRPWEQSAPDRAATDDARERASLNGLSSPIGASTASVPPVPVASAPAVAPPPGMPPLRHPGISDAGNGAFPGNHSEALSAPLPGAIQTPTAASAAAAEVRRGASALPAAAGTKDGRKPPSQDPPPLVAIQGATGDEEDNRSIEKYIPFGFVELRERLLADHPEAFRSDQVRKDFAELCRRMSLRNTLRLEIDYGDAHEKYALLDPDRDTLVFKVAAAADKVDKAAAKKAATDKAAAAADKADKAAADKAAAAADKAAAAAAAAAAADKAAGGGKGNAAVVGPPGSRLIVPKGSIKSRVDAVYGELDNIFNRAEFLELPEADLVKARNDKSLMGLDVTSASDEYLEYRIHYRGTRQKKIQWRRWGLFKRQIEMTVYERLAITFRLRKPVSKEDLPEEPSAAGLDTRPWYKRLCGASVKGAASLHELRDEFLYMKLFKNVLQCDVDMLLPGAIVKFTWFDHVLVWAPILFGCAMAIWKAVTGSINFSNLKDALLSVVLIVMPLTWGVRAFMAIKEKQRLHQAHLNALFLLHNLNNNAGALSQLLDEVQEQEDNESMLAYFFLWRGKAPPQPMRKRELDRAVEGYVQGKLAELGLGELIRLDFDVEEAKVRLERLGLIKVAAPNDLEQMLQPIPLDEALELAHVRHFDESRETGQAELPRSQTRRGGKVADRWHECFDVFLPTGQRFRYFWNTETGESSYIEPDEPYVKSDDGPATDYFKAHGVAMSDPAKQVGTTAANVAAAGAAKGAAGGQAGPGHPKRA